MIILNRLNGEEFTLNACMIEHIQSHPDTTITLLNGRKFVVANPEDDVVNKIVKFYQTIGLIGSMRGDDRAYE